MHHDEHALLTDVPLGTRVRISRLTLHPEMSTRLRELGLFENAIIRPLARSSGSLVCEIHKGRIGLNRAVAQSIVVASE